MTFRSVKSKIHQFADDTVTYVVVKTMVDCLQLVFNNISFSWLLPLDGFQFIFLLCDSENDQLYGKTLKRAPKFSCIGVVLILERLKSKC